MNRASKHQRKMEMGDDKGLKAWFKNIINIFG